MNMDFNALKEQVTNLSLYDLKAGVRKVQNGKPSSNGEEEKGPLILLYSRHELYGDGGEGKWTKP